MLCYECNQQCFNSVQFKKYIQNISIHGQCSHRGSGSRCVWCPGDNKNLKGQIKQKAGKCNGETKKAHNDSFCERIQSCKGKHN